MTITKVAETFASHCKAFPHMSHVNLFFISLSSVIISLANFQIKHQLFLLILT